MTTSNKSVNDLKNQELKSLTITNPETNITITVTNKDVVSWILTNRLFENRLFLINEIVQHFLNLANEADPFPDSSCLHLLLDCTYLTPPCSFDIYDKSYDTTITNLKKKAALYELCSISTDLTKIIFGPELERLNPKTEYHSVENYLLSGCWLIGEEWEPCSEQHWTYGDGQLRQYVFMTGSDIDLGVSGLVGTVGEQDWSPAEYDDEGSLEKHIHPYTRLVKGSDLPLNCIKKSFDGMVKANKRNSIESFIAASPELAKQLLGNYDSVESLFKNPVGV